ncbi:hypothetical protein HK101_004075 [Irineochytrium annulatum]|nr:hypothetical protein HK101_004075 [Irineochytrium annulatum]
MCLDSPHSCRIENNVCLTGDPEFNGILDQATQTGCPISTISLVPSTATLNYSLNAHPVSTPVMVSLASLAALLVVAFLLTVVFLVRRRLARRKKSAPVLFKTDSYRDNDVAPAVVRIDTAVSTSMVTSLTAGSGGGDDKTGGIVDMLFDEALVGPRVNAGASSSAATLNVGAARDERDVGEWNVQDVASWLEELELWPEIVDKFRAGRVDGVKLLLLTDDGLSDLGLTSEGERDFIAVAIGRVGRRGESAREVGGDGNVGVGQPPPYQPSVAATIAL